VSSGGSEPCPYVGRGGLKLAHALQTFGINPMGMTCADLGCNVGGFTDCLLQAGASHVFAVDTGYGALAWKMRQDPRVTVMERTNALHAAPPTRGGTIVQINLIAIDLGWTPQRHAIPAALRWLSPGGRIITLIKPHYELLPDERSLLNRGILEHVDAERIAQRAAVELPSLGVRVVGVTRSPIEGGAGKGKSGNAEWLALVERDA